MVGKIYNGELFYKKGVHPNSQDEKYIGEVEYSSNSPVPHGQGIYYSDNGDQWKQIHSTLDYTWIALVVLGLLRDAGHRWWDVFYLILFWGSALVFIYLPMWRRNE